MKFTIFGLSISSSWGNGHATPYRALIKALHRLGHGVHFYEKDVPYYAKHRDFGATSFCDLRLYSDWNAVRGSALKLVRDSDVVMCASYCPEGARIANEVLDVVGPLKVFYDLDTPVTLSALERGGIEYLDYRQIPAFDVYFSFTGGGTLAELTSRWGAKKAVPLYGCVDPDIHFRTAPRAEFTCDLSYMGTYAPDREAKLDALFLDPACRLPASNFLLAGSLYPWDWRWPTNVRKLEHVSPYDHSVLYSSSRLTLNITRTEMARGGYCPSGRFFEAAACGTPIMSDWFEGLDAFFAPEQELFVVESVHDVLSAIKRPNSELAAIADRARQRTLEEHTGDRRAGELIAAIEQAQAPPHPERARSEVA